MLRNRKGFTLVELMVVVAVLVVLLAIAMTAYFTITERSREATDIENVRVAVADVVTHYLADHEVTTVTVPVHQAQTGWQTDPAPQVEVGGVLYSYEAKTTGEYTVTVEVNEETGEFVPKIS